MFTSRIATGFATLLIGGVAVAALAPVMPFQEPVQPTPHHKTLIKGAGNWEGTIKYWMPDTPDPMESPCTETVFSLGELWTVSHFEMDFMGQTFSGSATVGYDIKKKKFVGTWIDSGRTSITEMEGVWDEAKKAIVMDYEMFDPMAGGDISIRSRTVYGDDEYTMSSYVVSEGGTEEPQMVISMKRLETIEAGTGR